MSQCPICSHETVDVFLQRQRVPVTQNLIVTSQRAAREAVRGSLEMACCTTCGFVFNEAFDASLVGYGEEYDNTQSYSPSFDRYMDDIADNLLRHVGPAARVIEVGCGKGLFLKKLIGKAPSDVCGFGFDPSYAGPPQELDGRITFRRELYTPASAALRGDVVVCRHVIEHLSQPLDVLRTARAALTCSPSARVFFETPTVDWILRHHVHWDLFYEHCSLFTPASMRTAFALAGFDVQRVELTFGDQYMWVEATPTVNARPTVYAPGDVVPLAHEFARHEAAWVERWSRFLRERQTKTAIWGAGAKGVTFANLVDPDARWIDCVVDLNPQKQNHYLPGTGHPIVPPSGLRDRQVTTAILMNPNYRAENVALLKTLDLAVELVE